MRTRADSPTIPVSCGHYVPRVRVQIEGQAGNRYWCEACGAYRMSGRPSTGEQAFDFLLELRDEISARGLVVDFAAISPKGRQVVEALGAHVRITGRKATA